MINYNKYIPFLSVVVLSLTLILGCEKKSKQPYIIIAQYIDHPALEEARTGFINKLSSEGYTDGDNIRIEIRNAQGDNTSMQTITSYVFNNQPDLIFTLATPISQSIKQRSRGSNIPIIYGVITDPVSAGLVDSMDLPGGNNTASSDRWPYYEQIELIKKYFPQIKTIGILFNPGEANTEYAMKQTRSAADSLNISLIERAITSINDVPVALSSIIRNVDMMYVPADNTAMSAAPTIINIAKQNGVPTLAGDPATFRAGAVLGLAVSYYELGRKSAELALKILEDDEDPGSLSVATVEEPELLINLKVAKELNFSIPETLIHQADSLNIIQN